MTVAVDITGEGPGLVLTHGFGGSRRTWDTVAPILATRFTVGAWDLPGHGESPDVGVGNYSRELALEELAGVIEQVGTPVILVGHSLGGYLSMAHAIDHPTDVASLGLVATGPGFRKPEGREKWNRTVAKAEETFGVPTGSSGMVQQNDSRVIDGLGSIGGPAVLVVGEFDKRFHAAHEMLADKLKAPSVVIEGGGHQVQETHGDQVAAVISDLGGQSPSAAPRKASP
ncbi:MAG: alpha/beta fold hydrolase [Actinomycetia bacterium]|nr:alpha/beta fold hydrolase [Actinomycetes bacterium]